MFIFCSSFRRTVHWKYEIHYIWSWGSSTRYKFTTCFYIKKFSSKLLYILKLWYPLHAQALNSLLSGIYYFCYPKFVKDILKFAMNFSKTSVEGLLPCSRRHCLLNWRVWHEAVCWKQKRVGFSVRRWDTVNLSHLNTGKQDRSSRSCFGRWFKELLCSLFDNWKGMYVDICNSRNSFFQHVCL